MIEFAKITGEMDGNLIQVTMRTGESLFAPIAIMGTDVTIPSLEWVKRNKDSFLALVTYENDMKISPFVIGFFPVKGAKSESYNSVEKLLEVTLKLVEQLLKAKVNTMLGPQPFLMDTLTTLNSLKSDLENISKDIYKLNL